ncbi:hypothetical protein ACFY9C_35350 [Streptomyces filamentosus]|uniref:hypothetical protein n=1 Tax=Streptomyces filamentosus TaxID=67294 RepID=UPI0036E4A80E
MSDYRDLLALAEERIERANREVVAAADAKALVLDAEATRRGRGGAAEVAAELGVSKAAVSLAQKRARSAGEPHRGLPYDTLQRLFAAELRGLPARPAGDWELLAWMLRSTVVAVTWLEEPGALLAGEVEDLDDEYDGAAALAAACRSWSRVQALAVIDALLSGDLGALPVTEG